MLAAGQAVLDSLDRLQAALYGCRTPLNFYSENLALKKLRAQAAEVLEPIRNARDIIEMDPPQATIETHLLPFRESWAPPEGAWGTLSPGAVLDVRLRARLVGPDELTTYRQELEKQPKIPGLIRLQRRRAEHDAIPAEEKEAKRSRRRAARQANIERNRAAADEVKRQTAELAAEMDAAWAGDVSGPPVAGR